MDSTVCIPRQVSDQCLHSDQFEAVSPIRPTTSVPISIMAVVILKMSAYVTRAPSGGSDGASCLARLQLTNTKSQRVARYVMSWDVG